MQFSPLVKVLLACLGVVLGVSIFVARMDGDGGVAEETAELEARLAEAKAAVEPEDPVVAQRKKVRSMVWHREFDRLEKIAAASRKQETAEGEDYVDLYYFYEWSGGLSHKHEEHFWKTHLELLTAWKEAHPDSITPRIALAHYWIGYAWKARGGGWADSVTEEGWRLYGERLARAEQELDDVPLESRTDPHYFVQGLTVAMGLGLPKGEALHRFRSGLEVDRKCYALYDGLVYYFLPRWHGEPGEVGEVILKEAEKLGKDRNYALTQMVWSLYSREKDEVFDKHGIDYPVVKKVYEQWTSHHPNNISTANYYCLYACIAGDREAAKRMFDRIGENFEEFCWGSEENFRKWKKRYG